MTGPPPQRPPRLARPRLLPPAEAARHEWRKKRKRQQGREGSGGNGGNGEIGPGKRKANVFVEARQQGNDWCARAAAAATASESAVAERPSSVRLSTRLVKPKQPDADGGEESEEDPDSAYSDDVAPLR